jgi:hypothetical protein
MASDSAEERCGVVPAFAARHSRCRHREPEEYKRRDLSPRKKEIERRQTLIGRIGNQWLSGPNCGGQL